MQSEGMEQWEREQLPELEKMCFIIIIFGGLSTSGFKYSEVRVTDLMSFLDVLDVPDKFSHSNILRGVSKGLT